MPFAGVTTKKVRDKVGTGEYVLGRPPKKPGGSFKTILFVLVTFVAIEGVYGAQRVGEFDDEEFSENGADDNDLNWEGSRLMSFGKAVLGVLCWCFLLCQIKDAGGGRARYDVWSVSVATAASMLSKNFRDFLGEHCFAFAVVSTAAILTVNRSTVLKKCVKAQIKMRWWMEGVKAGFEQREVAGPEGKDTLGEGFYSELGRFLDSYSGQQTFEELFASHLGGFLRHTRYGGVVPKYVLLRVLWDKFGQEIRIFGKKTCYFKTCPNDLQNETVEWFFSTLWDEIEDLRTTEGHGWQHAVSLCFERLCEAKPLEDVTVAIRRKYPGADKWKKHVGLVESLV